MIEMLSGTQLYEWTGSILHEVRQSARDLGFVEIVPAVLSTRFEPGARHSVAVLGHKDLPIVEHVDEEADKRRRIKVMGERAYYLPVSHAVEKQVALEHMNRVYCLAPCVRLLMDGEHVSRRHLYTFFQIEFELRTEDVAEVFEVGESLLSSFALRLLDRMSPNLNASSRERISALVKVPYPRIPFEAAKQMIASTGPLGSDLTHAEESELGAKFQSPFWLCDYPEGVRDSLYRRGTNGLYKTYDLMLPFGDGELATGGLRPESGEEVVRQSRMLGKSYNPSYAEWKDRSGIQSGGFGIGLERLIKFCTGIRSILDVRMPHDSGPNATIEQEIGKDSNNDRV
ncbi:amino acid--tRNA ligase-related protein [Bradyrhizobium liaoningense]|uniref:amino acid--tRNA ligase-related protein n=1 Tax=Bradyrhizobium liaoningense TaxID=43992 RepID=UPI001BA784F7|nr:amino acid--tRNA ligase-related protein [Bradyrhizobium liaoningense]MBR1069139.1 hypothetical protein [Bradyrhizobium liaoningense]